MAEMDEIRNEFTTLLNEGTQAPEATAPEVEQADYYLGDKANKLPINAEFQIQHDGKPIRAPLSTILNHYRQRASLDGQYSQFKTEREKFEQDRGDMEKYTAMKQKYGDIQSWSEQYPKEWEALYEMYQNRDKHLMSQKISDPNMSPLVEELANLKKEFEPLKQFKSEFDKKQELEGNQKAFDEVKLEADAFGKEWPEIDLAEKNAEGLDLRRQIIVFGARNGHPNFKSAAIDFLGSRPFEIAQARARNEAVKGIKLEKQHGIIGRSPQPVAGKEDTRPTSNKSWGELAREAKEEFAALTRGST